MIVQNSITAQEWIDTNLYPFNHHFLELSNGNMHYIDEGNGEVILFVHGTPTWSFLYRDFVQQLSSSHRCIAIDHLGFGLSQKKSDQTATPQFHYENLNEFIQKLDLNNITLVVHDFGGPIGLSAGIQNHIKIKNIVLFNTWLWETKSNKEAQKINNIVNSWMGKFMYLTMNFSPKVLVKKAFYDKNNLSKNVHKHYIYPFPTKASRVPLLDLGKSLVGASDWYQQQWEQLSVLEHKNWLILWGTKDPYISKDYLNKWKSKIANAKIYELESGHFVQEEATQKAIQLMQDFL